MKNRSWWLRHTVLHTVTSQLAYWLLTPLTSSSAIFDWSSMDTPMNMARLCWDQLLLSGWFNRLRKHSPPNYRISSQRGGNNILETTQCKYRYKYFWRMTIYIYIHIYHIHALYVWVYSARYLLCKWSSQKTGVAIKKMQVQSAPPAAGTSEHTSRRTWDGTITGWSRTSNHQLLEPGGLAM